MTLLPPGAPPLGPVQEVDDDGSSIRSSSTAAALPSPPSSVPRPYHHQQHGDDEDWVFAATEAEQDTMERPAWSHQYLMSSSGGASAYASKNSSPDRSRHSGTPLYGADTFTPSSPAGSMGRARVSFTRMDNTPQVRIDLKHLSYFVKNTSTTGTTSSSSSSSSSWLPAAMRRRWPFATFSSSSKEEEEKAKSPPSSAPEPPETTMTPILQDITLSFTPGTLTGLMGPSGSGKTSLLHVLHGAAKHTRGGVLQGTVLVNGTPCRNIHSAFRKMCSLVPQEDVLLPELTVQETLRFAAELRLPQSDTKEERAETVNAVLLELGLDECKDVRVGCVEKVGGISGGQKRRVSIGLELLTDPSVLLLDEPTSGLDSKTAEDICNLLKSLAGPDRCVVLSLHQPSFQVFMSCFDRVVFLVTGRIAWDGPPNRLASFFYQMGYEAPSYENPADFYLKILQEVPEVVLEAWRAVAAKREKEDLETALSSTPGLSVLPVTHVSSSSSLPVLPRPPSRGRLGKLGAAFGSNQSMSRGGSTAELPSMVDGSTAGGDPLLVVPGGEVLLLDREATWLDKEAADVLQQSSLFYQFSVLLRRMMTHNCKDRAKVMVGLGMEIFTGLLVGIVWFQQEVYTQKSIFPVLGVFCMLTTISIFDSFLNLILTFPLTRALHFREYNNGYYHLLPYFLASMASACIMSALYQLSDVAIVFFMVGLPFSVKRFLVYMGVCAIGGCIGASLGFLVGCFTSDIKRMQQIVVPALLPLLIFSGYMIPLARMPSYLTWIYYGSFYQYIYSSLVISHFTDLVFRDCAPTTAGTPAPCIHRGEEILSKMALSPDQLTRNVGILIGTLALLLFCGYAALRYKSR